MPADASQSDIEAQMVDCVARRAVSFERTVREDATGAVAGLVASLEIVVTNHGHVFEIAPVARLLQNIITRCAHLDSLSLNGATTAQSIALLHSFATSAPALRSFSVSDGLDPGLQPSGPSALERFLHSQRTTLEHLTVTRSVAKPPSFAGQSELEMPALTSVSLTSTFEWWSHQTGWHDFRIVMPNSTASLTTLAVDLSWDLELDRFPNLADLTLTVNQHQLFTPYQRPHPSADERTLQRRVAMPRSVRTLRVTAVPARYPLELLKDDVETWDARPSAFEWADVVPDHVEVLDLSGLLVHPRSLVRWLKEREGRGQLRRVEWGVPEEGWKVVGWGLEVGAAQLKRVCQRMGVEWAERSVKGWTDETEDW